MNRFEKPLDPERCQESWVKDWHMHQCSRKPWKDGYCKQHHPDTVKARNEKRRAKWDKEAAERRARIEAKDALLAKGEKYDEIMHGLELLHERMVGDASYWAEELEKIIKAGGVG